MGKIKLLIKYFVYRIRRKGKRGYRLHSPFVFEFNRSVLNCKIKYSEYQDIKQYRRTLEGNREMIRTEDRGAGSRVFTSSSRRVCDIARYSASSIETGKLLFRLARYLNPSVVIELGTSLGFGTYCLAKGAAEGKIYSLEACGSLLSIAASMPGGTGIANAELIEGTFRENLPDLLERVVKVDLVYFDGDHRKESLLWQFSQCLAKAADGTVFVIGDIHWSPGMDEAWKIISGHPGISLSVDLFHCGLLFIREGMAKQHFVLGYSG